MSKSSKYSDYTSEIKKMFSKEDCKKAGIYKIENIKDGKVYIGSTKRLSMRFI